MFCRQTPVVMIEFLSFCNNINIVIVCPIQHRKVKSFALHRSSVDTVSELTLKMVKKLNNYHPPTLKSKSTVLPII